MDGLHRKERQRRGGDKAAVVILSAHDQIAARIRGLNAGADDYLVKPFDLDELSARVAAVARRYASQLGPVLRFGALAIDTANRQNSRGAENIVLSAREWAVLERLMRHPGAVVAKADIEEALYAVGAEVESNTVEVWGVCREFCPRTAHTDCRGLGTGPAVEGRTGRCARRGPCGRD